MIHLTSKFANLLVFFMVIALSNGNLKCPLQSSSSSFCKCQDDVFNHIELHEIWLTCTSKPIWLMNSYLQKFSEEYLVHRLTIEQSITNFTFESKWPAFPTNLRVRDLFVQDMNLKDTLPLANRITMGDMRDTLKYLSFRNCDLTSNADIGQFGILPSLYTLDLSCNDISMIPSNWFQPANNVEFRYLHLRYLYLRKNQIQFLSTKAFHFLRQLVLLDLSENQLETIQREHLPQSDSSLAVIRLSYNRLTYLPPGLFLDLPALRRVHLDNNQLHVARSDVWLGSSNWYIQLADFSNNPLRCDCDALWMLKMRINWESDFEGVCTSPPSLKGQQLSQLTPYKLVNAPELKNDDCAIYAHQNSRLMNFY